jgi:DNA invertase Pin-like site-specific DNA recombinase
MKKAIPYYRVSTERQGYSGLGLDAQTKAIRDYARANGLKLLKEFTEVESGRNSKRPVLAKALAECKKEDAILLIAKLDRLGRNVVFISTLMESKVKFIAVDNPYANDLMLHIMAAFAEHEHRAISTRTKEALKAAKRRGVKLGEFGKNVLSKRNRKKSEAFAKKMTPIIKKLKEQGYETVREIADELNKRRIATYSGKDARWHVATVHNLLARIKTN